MLHEPRDDEEELEWAVRQYMVATEYLMEVFEKHEDMNPVIATALTRLSDAIVGEWS